MESLMSLDFDVIKSDLVRAQQYPNCSEVRVVINRHAPAMLAELEEYGKRERQLALERNQLRCVLHQATAALEEAGNVEADWTFIRSTMNLIAQLGIHPDDYEQKKAERLATPEDPDAKL